MYNVFKIDQNIEKLELKHIKKIYKISFPRQERDPWPFLKFGFKKFNMKRIPEKKSYNFILGIRDVEKESKILGIAILSYIKSNNFCYGHYITIDPAFRNMGIGTQMIFAIKDYFINLSSKFNKEKPLGIFYEIQKHNYSRYNNSIRKQILAQYRFYNRLNHKKLFVPYFLPSTLPWYPKTPMHLMIYLFNDFKYLSKKTVLDIYDILYTKIYRRSKRKLSKWFKILNVEKWPEEIKLKSLF